MQETVWFSSFTTLWIVQIYHIRRTMAMTESNRIKTISRGMNLTFQAFPDISCYIERQYTFTK